MKDKTDIEYYIKGYLNNTLTESERVTFFNEVITEENREIYMEVAASLMEDTTAPDPFDEKLWPLFNRVVQADKTTRQEPAARKPFVHRVYFLRNWGRAAAVFILAISTAVIVYLTSDSNKKTLPQQARAANTQDIAPGKSGAVLILADGRQIILDSLENGVIASQHGAEVVVKNGGLAYERTGVTTEKVVHNTIFTPKGRQFQLTLPDGTQVWLNAASSIRYPTVFAGKERRVEIEGEVYFEVAKNINMPFRVNVNDCAKIEVLGTHFNVNAYENEKTLTTTLLEGSVRVQATGSALHSVEKARNRKQNGNAVAILKPGQQAQINELAANAERPASVSIVSNPDIEKIMAWKNGLFNFEGAGLEEVMRQLERWYNIEVVYEKGVPEIEFVGKMTKDVPLSGLLLILEKSKVRFRLDGRKLVVLP